MIVVTKPTSPISDVGILLGRQGENKARQIVFDLAWLIEEYGNGTAVLVHQRSKDSAPYICTTTQDGSSLTWTLNNLDTAYDGWGQAELRWTVSDVLAKTLVYKTMVVRSITADTTIPDPYESWYDQMIEYIDEHGGGGAVDSVNGKTGVVILNASDVHALPDSTTIPTKVSQLQNDSGFGTYSKPSGGIPKTDLASGVQASLDKADSALQTAPVTSVNNKTGAVTLFASDVGAGTYSKPSGGIPSSDMTSSVQTSLGKADSAYQKPSGGIPSTDMSSAVQTSLGKADSALQTAPVTSVNTKTGAVTLGAGDIGYDDSATYDNGTVGAELTALKGGYTDIDERVTALEQGGSGGLSESVKQALLQIASKVAYVDADGQEYYSDLYDAFYPPANLVSITAVYTQSGTVYTTDSLDSLKSDLVVTALYDDQTTATVTTYTLSGTLTEGTSSITVTYGGKTTTFTVTVTAATLSSISAVYTQSGTVYTTDSLDSLKTDLVVTAHWSNNTTSTVASADYTLSGTLTVGTSTITVSYEGKTTTFTVTVTDHSALPEGYTKYDYIANTLTVGTASSGNYDAILTDIDMSSDYTYETKILIPSSASSITNASPLMGTRNGASGTKQFGLFFTPSTGKLGYWFGGTDTATTITGLSLGSVLDIKIRPVGASSTYPTKATIIVNNTEYDAGATASGQTWNSWFSFLKYAISATSVITSNQKAIGAQIGETKIKDGNTVLYDFIPCNNGTYYGVYELINGVFYYDATNYSNWTGGDWEV